MPYDPRDEEGQDWEPPLVETDVMESGLPVEPTIPWKLTDKDKILLQQMRIVAE